MSFAASSPLPPEQQALQQRINIRRELHYRHCRESLLACATHMLAPRIPAAHHRLICAKVQQTARADSGRLILIAPPGSAKTTLTSHIAPAWYFAANPNTTIIAISHTSDFAETRVSMPLQRFVNDNTHLLGYHLTADARGQWTTSNGCTFIAAGVGQAIRGIRADLIIVDDPIASRAAAESETMREALWDYFHSDLLPRLTPKGSVILIATAYHMLDLMCRLEREQSELWQVLRLPALCDDPATDPLDRALDEPLWNDDGDPYGYAARLLRIREEHDQQGRMRDWYAQFQGRPSPPEGSLFKPDKMPILEPAMVPVLFDQVRAWDLAASLKGDYTVGVKLGCYFMPNTFENGFVILDVQRVRAAPEEVRALIRLIADSDGYAVKIMLPQDPGSAGLDQVVSLTHMLSGYPIGSQRMSGDKVTRAYAVAAQANIGRIALVRAPWNNSFIEELRGFPSAPHDDQVDALSLAFSAMEAGGIPASWRALRI